MGKAATPIDTIWPDGADPKTLVCVKAQCSASELFDVLFVVPDLTEQLHKQRGDTELAESGWVSSKAELPQQMYTWEASGDPGKPSHTHRYRKVRFESPPAALASKPFQNEEMQVVTEMVPEHLYVVEAASTTSAPYGDKFNVFFRYVVRADGPGASALHLLFHVEFLPSMNRMMKPMVGKAIDAGVRSTFKIFRTVLGTVRPCADIKESELPAGPPAVHHHGHVEGEEEERVGAEGEEEVRGGEEHAARHHVAHPGAAGHVPHPGWTPGAGAMPGLLSVMTQQLVYKDQVVLLADLVGAGLRSVTHSDIGGQVLSAILTVWLISLAIAALRGWQAFCAPAAATAVAAGGGAGGLLLGFLRFSVCWPLRLVDLPENTTEVLASLALVAAINWAVIRAAQVTVRYLSEANPALLASLRSGPVGGGGGGGDGDGSGPGEVVGGVAFGQQYQQERARQSAAGHGSDGGAVQAQVASATADGAATAAGGGGGKAAVAGAGSAALTRAGSAPVKGKDKDKGGKGGAAAAAAPAPSGKGASAAAATAAQPPAKPKPLRAAPAPRQFSPAQLRQLELGLVSTSGASATAASRKESSNLPTAPVPLSAQPQAAAPTASASPKSGGGGGVTSAVPAMAAMADAWAADLPAGMVVRSEAPPAASVPSTSNGGAALAADTETSVSVSESEPSLSAKGQDAAAEGGSPLPVSRSAMSAMGAMQPTAAQLVAASAASTTAANSFANMFTREGIDSMAESLRSAFRWEAKASGAPDPDHAAAGSLTSPERSVSPGAFPPAAKAKARSDAGALLGAGSGGAAAAAGRPSAHRGVAAGASGRSLGGGGGGQANLGTTSAALSLYSAHSDMPLLGSLDEGDGDAEEPSVVVEEVFENERFQPFRGWGHMWPGHFLPSDRVGHWSDRQGKPGGSASMSFDQVVPRLPRGWRWMEEDWQVDTEGLDAESVDADGWTYALDFYLLKYPPPPQGGKCSMKHFVRRRRYFRTRVRCDDGNDSAMRSWDGTTATATSSGAQGDPLGDASESPSIATGALTARRDGGNGVETTASSSEWPEKVVSLAGGLASEVLGPDGEEVSSSAVVSRATAAAEPDLSDVELRPQPPLSSSAPSAHVPLSSSPPPSAGAGAGASGAVDLPRPKSVGAGLSESGGRLQGTLAPAASSPPGRWDAAGSSTQAPVAATLALLAGTGAGRLEQQGRTPGAAPGGINSTRPSTSSANGVGADVGVGFSPARVSAAADGDGDLARRSGEDFVLSPKTVVTSSDPLGALVDGQRGQGAASGSGLAPASSSGAAAAAAAAAVAAGSPKAPATDEGDGGVSKSGNGADSASAHSERVERQPPSSGAGGSSQGAPPEQHQHQHQHSGTAEGAAAGAGAGAGAAAGGESGRISPAGSRESTGEAASSVREQSAQPGAAAPGATPMGPAGAGAAQGEGDLPSGGLVVAADLVER